MSISSIRVATLVHSSNTIRVVLFDVGGVLVETSGVATMLSWMNQRISAEELWKIWLTSPCVRAFETGQTDPMSFASEIIAVMELPVHPQRFLDEMSTWSTNVIAGVEMQSCRDTVPGR